MPGPTPREPPAPASGPAPSSAHATLTMRANRRRDTGPELQIRSLLHRAGLRFRVDERVTLSEGSVRPDLVFRRARVAVFVDGCFWHACPEHGELPQANRKFWKGKLQRTAERDKRQTGMLEAEGWLVIRIWEHEDPQAGADRVRGALESRKA